jgi:hypothetical protein
VAKFNIDVDRPRRLPPAERSVKTEFSGRHIAEDQGLGVEAVGRERAELILP